LESLEKRIREVDLRRHAVKAKMGGGEIVLEVLPQAHPPTVYHKRAS